MRADANSKGHKISKTKKKNTMHQQFGMLVLYIIFSIIEGMAIGIQKKIPALIFITTLVFTHKSAEIVDFSLFLRLGKALGSTHLQFILIYSLMVPVGVGIGLLVESFDSNICSFFLAFVSGGFLYIGLVPLMIEEFQYSKY